LILHRTENGWIVRTVKGLFRLQAPQSGTLTALENLGAYLAETADHLPLASDAALNRLLAPIENQEVWAAGVTYSRSRSARMEEARTARGSDFYDLVYHADRPELFFKSTASRVIGPGGNVRIRGDATWNVPEPEIALLISPKGKILGYTIGNDMSSRDIEGQNPLYLPQAKIYDGSCAIGPAILVTSEPLSPATRIELEIRRETKCQFKGTTALSEMRRDFQTLVDYLYRETSFQDGCFLLTGTGIVPPDDFTLQHGDEILITVDGIGTLQNRVQ
jgi:2-dehydro-3-deoxy-D-arabinonate dehydratase